MTHGPSPSSDGADPAVAGSPRRPLVPWVLAGAAVTGAVAHFVAPPWEAVVGLLALLLLLLAGFQWWHLHRQVSLIANEWQITVDAVEFPVVTLDAGGRVVRLNRAAQRLSGRSFQANLGRPVEGIGKGEPWSVAARLLPEAAPAGVHRQVEEVVDGERRVWEVSVCTVERAVRARPGFVVLGRDVTERVELEDRLRHQEVMSALGSLVANVAHEARNPLFALGACADSLQRRYGERGELGDYLPVLSASVDRLQRLMADLLDYGKPVRPELREERLAPILEEARESMLGFAREARVELVTEAAEDLPPVRVDRERIFQVLRNLLENAIQHSPEGGAVTAVARDASGCAEVEVRDMGPGFAAEDLPRIYEPFFSRRSGGTGLGLSIVQRVVEQHEGEMEADNLPQGGARFRIWLPYAG